MLAGLVATAACARTTHDEPPSFSSALAGHTDDLVILREPEPMPTPAWDPIVACESHDDCVVVEMGCCEGEWTMSIARAAQDEAEQRWAKDCPRGRRCFERIARGWVEATVCDQGACARIEEQLVLKENGSWSEGLVLVQTSEPPWAGRPPAQAQTLR